MLYLIFIFTPPSPVSTYTPLIHHYCFFLPSFFFPLLPSFSPLLFFLFPSSFLAPKRLAFELALQGDRKNDRRESNRTSGNLTIPLYSPVEARGRKNRLIDLETSLELVKSKYERKRKEAGERHEKNEGRTERKEDRDSFRKDFLNFSSNLGQLDDIIDRMSERKSDRKTDRNSGRYSVSGRDTRDMRETSDSLASGGYDGFQSAHSSPSFSSAFPSLLPYLSPPFQSNPFQAAITNSDSTEKSEKSSRSIERMDCMLTVANVHDEGEGDEKDVDDDRNTAIVNASSKKSETKRNSRRDPSNINISNISSNINSSSGNGPPMSALRGSSSNIQYSNRNIRRNGSIGNNDIDSGYGDTNGHSFSIKDISNIGSSTNDINLNGTDINDTTGNNISSGSSSSSSNVIYDMDNINRSDKRNISSSNFNNIDGLFNGSISTSRGISNIMTDSTTDNTSSNMDSNTASNGHVSIIKNMSSNASTNINSYSSSIINSNLSSNLNSIINSANSSSGCLSDLINGSNSKNITGNDSNNNSNSNSKSNSNLNSISSSNANSNSNSNNVSSNDLLSSLNNANSSVLPTQQVLSIQKPKETSRTTKSAATATLRKSLSALADNERILQDYNYYDDDDFTPKSTPTPGPLGSQVSSNAFWLIPFIKIRNTYVLQRAVDYNNNVSTRSSDTNLLTGRASTGRGGRGGGGPPASAAETLSSLCSIS